jgi:hypothetical protein
MPAVPRSKVATGVITRLLSRLGLRFPALFLILLCVTIADFVIPDPIPFVDEIILSLLTVIFGLWKDRRKKGPVDGAPQLPPR